MRKWDGRGFFDGARWCGRGSSGNCRWQPLVRLRQPLKLLVAPAEAGALALGQDRGELIGRGEFMSWIERAWVRLRESLARYRAEIGVRDEAVELQREWLGDLRGKRVLEIGCGAGNILTMEIARAAGEYVGVDLLEDRVRKLQERLQAAGLEQARAQAGDVLAMDGSMGRFDVIYAGSVLHAFSDIDGAARALQGLLKPGGVLVAWEPMNTGWAVRLARGLYRPFQPNRKWHHPLRVSDVGKWRGAFPAGGSERVAGVVEVGVSGLSAAGRAEGGGVTGEAAARAGRGQAVAEGVSSGGVADGGGGVRLWPRLKAGGIPIKKSGGRRRLLRRLRRLRARHPAPSVLRRDCGKNRLVAGRRPAPARLRLGFRVK